MNLSAVQNFSPLRYPGGKSSLFDFLSALAKSNDLEGGHYCELYAGGAGAALKLLFNNVFSTIHINDADYHIYHFWNCVINQSEDFIHEIEKIDITIDEWQKQKSIYENPLDYSELESTLATFFLNRTNRSGIIYKAGPIGGYGQLGNYGINVRFNKKELIQRIEKIATFKEKILLTNQDAITILNDIKSGQSNGKTFLYLDPPYYNKGRTLYLNN